MGRLMRVIMRIHEMILAALGGFHDAGLKVCRLRMTEIVPDVCDTN